MWSASRPPCSSFTKINSLQAVKVADWPWLCNYQSDNLPLLIKIANAPAAQLVKPRGITTFEDLILSCGMKEVQSQIERLEGALNHLIAEHLVLRKENEVLRAKLQEQEEILRQKQSALESTKTELARVKLARSFGVSTQETKLAKAKLSSLMREIDRCIAMLND